MARSVALYGKIIPPAKLWWHIRSLYTRILLRYIYAISYISYIANSNCFVCWTLWTCLICKLISFILCKMLFYMNSTNIQAVINVTMNLLDGSTFRFIIIGFIPDNDMVTRMNYNTIQYNIIYDMIYNMNIINQIFFVLTRYVSIDKRLYEKVTIYTYCYSWSWHKFQTTCITFMLTRSSRTSVRIQVSL